MPDLTRDIQYSVRLLRRTPGFTIAAVLTLALGIGATTAIYSVLDAVLLQRAPFADANRLVMIWETDRASSTNREPASIPDYLDMRTRARSVRDLATFIASEVSVTPQDAEPRRHARLFVTDNFTKTTGIEPIVGRPFSAAEAQPGGPAVALISEHLWERDYNRNPGVVGQTLLLDERPHTIIGVMPAEADYGVIQILTYAAYSRSFADRDRSTRVDLWTPLQADAQQLPRETHPNFVIGRLAPGASVALAQQEFTTIMADLERTYPDANENRGAFVESMNDVVYARVRPGIWLLFGAVGLVLLIACVNVANLLLARGTTRLREIAVRSAMGAQGRRLARQFAVENVVLTVVAAVLGVALAMGGLRLLMSIAPADIPRLAQVSLDARLLGGTVVLAVVIGLIFGMLPLVQARRLNIQQILRSEDTRKATAGRGSQITRSALVVSEVALAVVLVVGAGLLLKSFWTVQRIDPGFDANGVLKAEFQLPRSRYPGSFANWPDWVEMHRFNAELMRRAAALPGVESVALAGDHPAAAGFTNSFSIVGREAESRDFPEISVRRVTGSYFATVRLALRRGELFGEVEPRSAPVAVINETSARSFFPNSDPIGQQIAFWGTRRNIIGVVADEKIHGLTSPTPPAVYVPLWQAPSISGAETVLLRAGTDLGVVTGQVRSIVRELDPGLAVFGAQPLAETVAESLQQRRFVMLLLALFAILAVTLAVIGIHGVLAYTVSQRQHEIGIRMALGATPQRVTQLVMGYGIRLAALGIVIGVVVALLSSRLLASLLYGVATTDAATLAGAVVLLTAAALLATYLPVRGAVRIDPMNAVRDQ
jgi:putative ABC transport system permease protein